MRVHREESNRRGGFTWEVEEWGEQGGGGDRFLLIGKNGSDKFKSFLE